MKRRKPVKVPPKSATDEQIVKFLRSHDPEDLIREGIMAIDEDHSDLEEALLAYLSEPRDARLSVPLPRTAKRMLEELARRGVNELHVEAGLRLNGSLLREGCVDELLLYLNPSLLGDGAQGMFHLPPFDALEARPKLSIRSVDRVGDDLRILARL